MRSQRPVWGPQGAGAHRGRGPTPGSAPVASDSVNKPRRLGLRASPAPSYIKVPWSFGPGRLVPRPSPCRRLCPRRRVGEASPSQASPEQEGLQVSRGGPWDFVETDSAGEKGLRRGRTGTAHLSFPTCETRGLREGSVPSNQGAGEVRPDPGTGADPRKKWLRPEQGFFLERCASAKSQVSQTQTLPSEGAWMTVSHTEQKDDFIVSSISPFPICGGTATLWVEGDLPATPTAGLRSEKQRNIHSLHVGA